MDPNVIGGIIRAVGPGLLGLLVGKGIIPATSVGPLLDWIVTGVVTIGAAWWSVKTNTAPTKAN